MMRRRKASRWSVVAVAHAPSSPSLGGADVVAGDLGGQFGKRSPLPSFTLTSDIFYSLTQRRAGR